MTNIEELLILKQDLDKATEFLNLKIEEFQNELQKLSMGVQVWIDLSENTKLGYGKYEGKWVLMVNYFEFEERKNVPLLRASRTLRLYCYKHLHDLLPALKKESESFLKKIQDTLQNDNNNNASRTDNRIEN